jgi:hypothetical protein
MAKRRYYSAVKRQRELERAKKNETKLERRRLKKDAAESEQLEEEGEVAEGGRVGEADGDNTGSSESG